MTRSKRRLFRLEDVNAARDPLQLSVTPDGGLVAMCVAEALGRRWEDAKGDSG